MFYNTKIQVVNFSRRQESRIVSRLICTRRQTKIVSNINYIKMKRIYIKSIESQNFKALNSRTIEMPPGGIVVAGWNGSGKSSILQSVEFCLGVNFDAERIINQATKAPASVSMVLDVDGQEISLKRVLTPKVDAVGKIISSSSAFYINGDPIKAGEFSTYVNRLFGTSEFRALINPAITPNMKSARTYTLQIAGAPTEKQYMDEHFPELAKMIDTDYDTWLNKQAQAVQSIGAQIKQAPGKISELSALIVEVQEIDTTAAKARLSEIQKQLAEIESENQSAENQYNAIKGRASELRAQANTLRSKAGEIVADANRKANAEVYEAMERAQKWEHEGKALQTKIDQKKSEIAAVQNQLSGIASELVKVNDNINATAEKVRSLMSQEVIADGFCIACSINCQALQEKGQSAAEKKHQEAIDAAKSSGRTQVCTRNQLTEQNAGLSQKLEALTGELETLQTEMTNRRQRPEVPTVEAIKDTPESIMMMKEADILDRQAAEMLQQGTPGKQSASAELLQETQRLNDIISQAGVATTQAKQNTRLESRIKELQEEQQALTLQQLQHQKNIAMLKDFYKSYAEHCTNAINEIFQGSGYEVRLWEENMKDSKGSITFQPMKGGSTNLSTGESMVFYYLFIQRVLAPVFGVESFILVDYGECITDETKLGSKHQKIVAVASKCDFEVIPLDIPKASNAK